MSAHVRMHARADFHAESVNLPVVRPPLLISADSDSVDAFYATYGALMAVALLRFLPALCGCGGSSRSK